MKIKKTLSVVLALALSFSQSILAVKVLHWVDPETAELRREVVPDCAVWPSLDSHSFSAGMKTLPRFMWYIAEASDCRLYMKNMRDDSYVFLPLGFGGVVCENYPFAGALLIDFDKRPTPEERAFRRAYFS